LRQQNNCSLRIVERLSFWADCRPHTLYVEASTTARAHRMSKSGRFADEDMSSGRGRDT